MAVDKLRAEWFWCDRWATSSAFLLPVATRGVYREMLTAAWARGASLPNDHAAIQRAAGISQAEWRRHWPVIEKYWRAEGDRLVNDTQVAIYREAQQAQQKASDRGRKGAQARAQARAQVGAQAPTQVAAQAVPKAVLKDKPPSLSQNKEHKERTAPLPRRPIPTTWKRAVAIAFAVMEAFPTESENWTPEFKARCSAQGIDYGARGGETQRPLFARALDYAERVRINRPRKAS